MLLRSHRKIALKYARAWLWIDLVSTVPVDSLFELSDLWTNSIAATDYAEFLSGVFGCITKGGTELDIAGALDDRQSTTTRPRRSPPPPCLLAQALVAQCEGSCCRRRS